MEEINYSIAEFIARVSLGLLFLFQGYDKVFKIKLKNVIQGFNMELENSRLPEPLISISAYYSSYVELVGGLLLILGFMKYYVLYALGLDLLLVAVAMGIINPLWKMDLVFPRLALLLLLLLLPQEWDLISLDHFISQF
jgi:uncharacterized membrane protein YphA (DoxX/SURF4 family)